MSKWPKISGDFDTPFEAFTKTSRLPKREPKRDKATETHISDLESQRDRLSRANLALTNLLKRAIHLAPNHLQKELHSAWDAIREASFDEVHP